MRKIIVFRNFPLIGRIFFSPLFARKGSLAGSNLDTSGNFVPYGGIRIGIVH